ncbi:hypothetical protein [Nitrosovibrio sp. Nv17]|uniref:hypothetical protein n=1 Tax=Nitrosovibrio sp. Nv17 TaxID=1855339 RepID=UPI000908B69C|nr:hypothetical protein [Nitrosovibrio sp. Nv17]SFW26939.1 hypothetical protein SAMN05216414_11036 [Nitrosovibrio sp. Nv17]
MKPELLQAPAPSAGQADPPPPERRSAQVQAAASSVAVHRIPADERRDKTLHLPGTAGLSRRSAGENPQAAPLVRIRKKRFG